MLGRERSYCTEDDGEQGCERLLCEEELFQLGEIGWRDVGNCAEGKAVLLPGEPMVALGFASAIPVAFRRALFHEDIDDVLAAGVDEGTLLSSVAQGSNWNTATPRVKDKEHLFSIT
jgi:hypothetical protein